MDMDVDETGSDNLAGSVNDLDIPNTLGKGIDDDPLFDEKIADTVDAVGRINDATALEMK